MKKLKTSYLSFCNIQAPVVRRLAEKRCPVDKCLNNKPRYALDSDVSGGHSYPSSEQPGPVLITAAFCNRLKAI